MHPHEYAGLRQVSKPELVLDDDALLTSAQTQALVGGVSAMCIWRWIRDPRVQLPAPIKINQRNYWRRGDLRAWLAARSAPTF